MTVKLDPDEKRDVYFDLVGDAIASATWSAAPLPPATDLLGVSTPVNETTRTTVRLAGIKGGDRHLLTCHIVGASGQEFDATAIIVGVSR